MSGLNMAELIDADSAVSDGELRWAARTIIEIEGAGPSMAADLQAALAAAAKAAWWRERNLTTEDIERINDLAEKLVAAFGIDMVVAQVAAKEVLFGTRKLAVQKTIKQYHDMARAEAEQKEKRQRQKERLESRESTPIVIEAALDVPAAVALAQRRRHHR
jgi:hypothetical protein